jgi:hypothetical protein
MLKQGYQDIYIEIGSNTHYSINTNNNYNTYNTNNKNLQPTKQQKLYIAPAITLAIYYKHTPKLRHREPSPIIALLATIPEIDNVQP